MERLGSDELISIYQKLQEQRDRRLFSQVSKNFLKATCINIRRFNIVCPRLLNVILPGSPNLSYLMCLEPLSNEHMKLLAQSCPKLENLDVMCSNFDGIIDHPDKYEFDFDDDGLCALANACTHLYNVSLSGRLHVGDLGVVSLVRSSKNLTQLNLARCVKITDESLKAIGDAATCLKALYLQGCYLITDLGLKYLANGDLKNSLDCLYLAECVRISDAGIIYLKQMVNLIILDLSKCGDSITDIGILAIAKIQNIVVLRLSWLINISDISMFEIASSCLKLKTVDLTGCESITSEGLRALAHLPELSYLNLHSCHNISWEDVRSVSFSSLRNIGLSERIKTSHDQYYHLRFGHNKCDIHWD